MQTPPHTHTLRYKIIFFGSILAAFLLVALLFLHLEDMRELCGGANYQNVIYGVIALFFLTLALAGLSVRKVFHDQIIYNLELEKVNTKLRKASITDGLTKVFNHRYFEEKLAKEWERVQRFQHALSCVMIDIDNFKKINDAYGHAAGDAVLRGVASLLKSELREVDIISRYGGEEFTIILFEKPSHIRGLKITLERLRKEIEKAKFSFGGRQIKVTASLGGALIPNNKINSSRKLIQLADKAMYHAKSHGKNRSAVFGDQGCC
ncbi:MAG: GGDEF domain-containing protein [Patescibacteria group bacterium]